MVSSTPCELTPLGAKLVMGMDLSCITLLRLDLAGGAAPGNKQYKLKPYLQRAAELGLRRLVSFGGPWSNHLHALAATGAELGLQTVGLVRGDQSVSPSAMLQDAVRLGMQIHYLSRTDYRLRTDSGFLAEMQSRFDPCLIIPEGGAGAGGVQGCREIASVVPGQGWSVAALACGTGTTLAGLAQAIDPPWQALLGISVLKGFHGMAGNVSGHLDDSIVTSPWHIDHRFHCGGYARVSDELRAFMLEFEAVHGIPLDPVYTGKLLFALGQMAGAGELPQGSILAMHTGGLQGRRGYDWLCAG